MVLEAEFQTSLVANQLTHLSTCIIVCALLQIGIVCSTYTSTLTNSLDNAIGRVSVSACACWSPSLVSHLCIVEEQLSIADTWCIVILTGHATWVQVNIATKPLAHIVACTG